MTQVSAFPFSYSSLSNDNETLYSLHDILLPKMRRRHMCVIVIVVDGERKRKSQSCLRFIPDKTYTLY